jgi:hypothetical protein
MIIESSRQDKEDLERRKWQFHKKSRRDLLNIVPNHRARISERLFQFTWMSPIPICGGTTAAHRHEHIPNKEKLKLSSPREFQWRETGRTRNWTNQRSNGVGCVPFGWIGSFHLQLNRISTSRKVARGWSMTKQVGAKQLNQKQKTQRLRKGLNRKHPH